MVDYACSICRKIYSSLSDAEQCESVGYLRFCIPLGTAFFDKTSVRSQEAREFMIDELKMTWEDVTVFIIGDYDRHSMSHFPIHKAIRVKLRRDFSYELVKLPRIDTPDRTTVEVSACGLNEIPDIEFFKMKSYLEESVARGTDAWWGFEIVGNEICQGQANLLVTELERVCNQLDYAIRNEDYEKAVTLKDRIKELTGGQAKLLNR